LRQEAMARERRVSGARSEPGARGEKSTRQPCRLLPSAGARYRERMQRADIKLKLHEDAMLMLITWQSLGFCVN
jgi:hypothetical protein